MEPSPVIIDILIFALIVSSVAWTILFTCLLVYSRKTAQFHYRRGYRDGAHSNLPMS